MAKSDYVSDSVFFLVVFFLVVFFLVVFFLVVFFLVVLVLAFLVTFFLVLVAFLVDDVVLLFVLVAFFADFFEVDLLVVELLALLLLLLAFPGKARQCALVLLPFLFTDALRHVHVELFEEHAELLKPTQALCAADVLMKPILNAHIAHSLIKILFIALILPFVEIVNYHLEYKSK